MLRRATHIVDSMPLAGKYAIEPAMKGYIRSEPGKELIKFAAVNALLGFMVVGHALQAKAGTATFADHLQHLASSGDASNGAYMGIDSTYAAINAAVTVRQASLMKRSNDIRKWRARRKASIQETEALVPTEEEPQSVSQEITEAPQVEIQKKRLTKQHIRHIGGLGLALSVTLGGQVAMGISEVDAINKTNHENCITSANTSVAAWVNKPSSNVDIEALQRSWLDFCDAEPSQITIPPSTTQTTYLPSPK